MASRESLIQYGKRCLIRQNLFCSTNLSFSTSAAWNASSKATKTTKLKDASRFGKAFPTRFNPVSSANKSRPILPPGLTYNPPASAPSPFDTPDIFLPAEERTNVSASTSTNILPPPLGPAKEKTYHLSEEQITEIKRLRLADPYKNTRKALAAQFNCSPFFIGMVAEAPLERRQDMERRLDYIKSKWSVYRKNARGQRARRRDSWAQDD
ncbi:mitochondrial ribosomal protein subunit L20-domain-containing protein [Dipodascopsis uninucleata]